MPRKIAPNQLKIPIQIPAAAAGTYFIDVSQIASLMNRKFVRQGLHWGIQNLEVIANGDCTVNISKLPETWVMSNAWTKSWHLWREMNKQVLDVSPSIQGKYADFKIYYDSTHVAAGVGANLLPFGFQTNTFGTGEVYDWVPSEIQIPNDGAPGVVGTYTLHGIGANAGTSKSMIDGYAVSRARPQQHDPNVPDDTGWMNSLFDVGDQLPEIRAELEDANDSPPYPIGPDDGGPEYYPGGDVQAAAYTSFSQDILICRANTALAMDSTGPFGAPCGLIRIDIVHGNVAPTLINFFIQLAPGPVKGFMAQPMQELN